MQAILIKFLPATNFKPARFKATCVAGSVTVCQDTYFDVSQNAINVVTKLFEKLEWDYKFQIGQLKNSDNVAVILDKNEGM